MKVVLFCGGLGTRMREYSETIPKAMVDIGYRPIIWHLMKYYASYGHKDFILCLGYKGDFIKNYFLNYNECLSNDFVMSSGGREVRLFNSDIEDWTITFVDTRLNSNIGQRLKSVKKYLEGEQVFMANYSDGLSDLPLADYLEYFDRRDKIASFLAVKPSQSFHAVRIGENNHVSGIQPVAKSDLWINGGFFVFKKEIFSYIQDGEELVQEPFDRLISQNQLITYPYQGFWASMDTFKEKQLFDDLYLSGNMPWAVWEKRSRNSCDKASSPVVDEANGSSPAPDQTDLVSYSHKAIGARLQTDIHLQE